VDFVVAGILIGAFFVGIGLVVRDLGPRKRPRIARDESREIAAETLARAWRRFCQSAGSLVMTLGLLILLATVLAMVVGLGDGAGLITVSATTAISLLVILFAGLTMPNHYRQGKFDPIMRSWRPVPRPAIERDVEYALPVAPSAHGEDPFYSPSRSTPARPVETFFPDASETDPGRCP
jgi:hypothetical protein